ncbi:MAG: hypothetical protein Q4B95_00230 [Lonepinella koalarum]|nr:hypothetical protein [Lonepinella koalarum]
MNKDITEIQELFNEIFDDADNLNFDSGIASKSAQLHRLCDQKILLVEEEIEELKNIIKQLENFKRSSNHYVNVVHKESSHFFK